MNRKDRKTRREVLAMLAALGVTREALAQDAVTADPRSFRVVLTNAQGTAVVRDIAAGQVFFAPAETHSVENIGGSGTRIYIIELKGRDWKPSTG
jgi:hypothetical protein